MPKKSGTKAKGAVADGSNVLNSTSTAGGPIRGASTTRGNKRRRTSNNVSSNSNEIYGSGTIVAANPFDDDHHIPMSNTMTSKMIMPPQMHQPTQMQPHMYLPHNYMQQQQHPMSSAPPHHPHLGMNTSGQMPMQDHLVNQQHPHQQPAMHHNHVQMMAVPHQNFGPPSQHGGPQQQMIGNSTSPHMMGLPVPHQSPYVHPNQGPMLAPPNHQVMSPHMEQPLMQQPYAISHNNVYCGKCQREIYQNESNIVCKAGCRSCFHISCSGLTQLACDMLMKESQAEWACDRCTSGSRRVPFVKYQS